MVATAATSSFFPVTSSRNSGGEGGGGGIPASLGGGGLKQNQRPASVKANAHAPSKINGTATKVPKSIENVKLESSSSTAPRTFINQLPDWSMLLAAITTAFLAAEKQWMMLDWKPKRSDVVSDPFGIGRIVQDGLAFRQNFSIRSYEIGADKTASIETLMNHLQLTCICFRGDVVQVDTWVSASGKNGMRRDWIIRDANTGEILTRASSVWVMMNKVTRRLSKIPEEVRQEIESYFVDSPPVVEEDNRKLSKLDDTAGHIRRGLSPRWSDLDVNQHVNNVKYIGWLLESAPQAILESHELRVMTLEYRRECGKDSVLDSLTDVSAADIGNLADGGSLECKHLLRLEDGGEIVRGRTEWRPKSVNNFGAMNQVLPAEN
ncbi:hypothetical protein PIB30_042477 [Stylosanthes scabra]|uniref:Acyl-[acyl-carrier-protein] hydrolase n=1 Tax=Stylosanthes scabra TaxID=79078 RepID=A0ABU6WDB3_9FABA|nr:hypothetical protein [Stylosanthes scabra]